ALTLGPFTTSTDYIISNAGSIDITGALGLNGTTNSITATGATSDITLSAPITHSNASPSTLALNADRNVSIASGGSITSSGGTLGVTLNARASGGSTGYISMANGTSIASNGGAITLWGAGGGAAIGDASTNVGVNIDGATLSAAGGNINIVGQGG